MKNKSDKSIAKVLVLTDFDGTVTGREGSRTVFGEFYQSLLKGYRVGKRQDYKKSFLEDPEKVQELFENKFGKYDRNFDYTQKDSDILMSAESVEFFKKLLNTPNITINIVTKNRQDYIQSLFRYHGFSQEEINKLIIDDSGLKADAVHNSLKSQEKNDNKPTHIYILDDNEEDFNEMVRTVESPEYGYKAEQIKKYNVDPGQFKWDEYQYDINTLYKNQKDHNIKVNNDTNANQQEKAQTEPKGKRNGIIAWLIAGPLGGFAAGAVIGSVIPGLGTLIGGIAGLITGIFVGGAGAILKALEGPSGSSDTSSQKKERANNLNEDDIIIHDDDSKEDELIQNGEFNNTTTNDLVGNQNEKRVIVNQNIIDDGKSNLQNSFIKDNSVRLYQSLSSSSSYKSELNKGIEPNNSSENQNEKRGIDNNQIIIIDENDLQFNFNEEPELKLQSDEIKENNALHNAILDPNSKEMIENLIKDTHTDELKQWLTQKSLGNTPLLLAAKTCNFAAVNILCQLHKEHGISVEEEDGSYLRALHWACFYKNEEMIKALIDAGAHPKNGYRVGYHRHFIPKDMISIPTKDYKNMFNKVIENEDVLIKETDDTFIRNGALLIGGGGTTNPDSINFSDVFFHLDRVAYHLNLLTKEELESLKTPQSLQYFSNSTRAVKDKFLDYIEKQLVHKDELISQLDYKNDNELISNRIYNQELNI